MITRYDDFVNEGLFTVDRSGLADAVERISERFPVG
jgi:hypothetical protein